MTTYRRISATSAVLGSEITRTRIRDGGRADRRARRVHVPRLLRARPRQRVGGADELERRGTAHGARPLGRDRAAVHARGRRAAARLRRRSSTRSPGSARSGSGAAPHRAVRPALGAMTGGQAVQMVKAGLEGDLPLRLAGRRRREPRRPDVSRPEPLSGQQRARARAAHQQRAPARRPDRARPRATTATHWLAPIVADAEAGFGGPLNAFELMKAMIEAGAAGVHFEDQLASEKKCGHLGGKVLVPDAASSSARSSPRGSPPTCCDVPTVARRPHRRALGDAADERRRRDATPSSSPASARRRASSASATGSSRRSPARSPTRRTPT